MADLEDFQVETSLLVSPPKGAKYQTTGSLIAGSFAAAASKTATAPLSRLTILFQIQAATGTSFDKGAGLGRALKQVVHKEGFKSLWKGNAISVLHKFPYGGLNYFAYEQTKVNLQPFWSSESDPGILVRFVSGFAGGSLASSVTYPMDTLRTRLAVSTLARPQFFPVLTNIVRTEGVGALYHGILTTLLCQGTNIAINFAVYETLQRRFLRNSGITDGAKQRTSWMSTLACGTVAGSIASVFVFPLDLVRRRQQISGQRRPALAVAREIAAREGWRGFYRGLVPELAKVIPAVGINFYVYELVRQEVLGLHIAPR